MKSMIIINVIIALYLCLCTGFVEAGQGYHCTFQKNIAPRMDGRIENDAFWQAIPPSEDFRLLRALEKTPQKRTWFKMAYNEEAIFIGVWCEEPEMDKIQVAAKLSGAVWKDDGVEIFLHPSHRESYLHFIVNTDEVRYNGILLKHMPLWDWQAKCYKGAGFYSFEIQFVSVFLIR